MAADDGGHFRFYFALLALRRCYSRRPFSHLTFLCSYIYLIAFQRNRPYKIIKYQFFEPAARVRILSGAFFIV
jgi:hypothetical protein